METTESIDRILESELRTDMTNTDATSRIENLAAETLTLLRRNGLLCIIKDNPKIVVKHVCNPIHPRMSRKRIESDLRLPRTRLRNDFKAFWWHAIHLADLFQLVDNGKPSLGDGYNKRGKNEALAKSG